MQPTISKLSPPPPSQAPRTAPTPSAAASSSSSSKFWSIPVAATDPASEFQFGKSVNNTPSRTGVGTAGMGSTVEVEGGDGGTLGSGGALAGAGRRGSRHNSGRVDTINSDDDLGDRVTGEADGTGEQYYRVAPDASQGGGKAAGPLKTPTPFMPQHRLPPTASMTLGGSRIGLFSTMTSGGSSSGAGSTHSNPFGPPPSRPQPPAPNAAPTQATSPATPLSYVSHSTTQSLLFSSALASAGDTPDTPITPAVKRSTASRDAGPTGRRSLSSYSAQPQRHVSNNSSRTPQNDNPRKRAPPSSPPPVPRANSSSTDRAQRIIRTSSGGNEGNGGAQSKKIKCAEGVDLHYGITEMMRSLDRKDAEIASLKAQVVEKSAEATKSKAERDKIKHESISKVKLALSNAETMQAELRDSTTAMRSAFLSIGNELGGIVAADEIKEELVGIKAILAQFKGPDGAITLEREERTKLPVLRSLENEVTKRQAVIDLLREQLATRTGEISEARDRVNQLEDQTNVKLKSIDHYALRLQELEGQLEKKSAHGKELEDARDKICLLQSEVEESKCSLKSTEADLAQTRKLFTVCEKGVEGLQASKDAALARVEQLTTRLEENKLEIEQLAPLRLSLSRSEAELQQARQTVADGVKNLAISDSLHQNIVGDLTRVIDELKAQSTAKDRLVVDSEERLARLTVSKDQATTSYIQRITNDYDQLVSDLQAREKELLAVESELRNDLRLLRTKLADRPEGSRGSGESNDEIKTARLQTAALRTTIASLETNNANLRSENASLLTLNADPSSTSTISTLRLEQARLIASESSARSKLEELEATQATLIQTTAAQTFKNCEEGSKRELALRGNELKRANNRLDECNKKLQKVLTELAIAKNRPLIDAHVTSSSPDYPIGFVDDQTTRSASRNTVHFDPVTETIPTTRSSTSAAPAVVLNKPSPPSTLSLSDLNVSPPLSEDIGDFSYNPAPQTRDSESPIKGSVSSDDVEVIIPPVVGRGPPRNRSATLESTKGSTKSLISDGIEDGEEEEVISSRSKARPVKTTYSTKKRK